jgi:hypothetical protein
MTTRELALINGAMSLQGLSRKKAWVVLFSNEDELYAYATDNLHKCIERVKELHPGIILLAAEGWNDVTAARSYANRIGEVTELRKNFKEIVDKIKSGEVEA